ncbi:MAG: diguanylate cyclase [Ideonella sp.]
MSIPSTPSEIAREALKALAARRLLPTPENYAQAWQEIAGEPAAQPPLQSRAIEAEPARPALAWPQLIRELLKQLDTTHRGVSLSRKKDGVQTVLKNFSSDADKLFEKLQGLMKAWTVAPTAAALAQSDLAAPAAVSIRTGLPVAVVQTDAPAAEKAHDAIASQLREWTAATLELSFLNPEDLRIESRFLAQQVRATSDLEQTHRLSEKLRQHWDELEFRDSERTANQEGAARLLRLLVNNIGELTSEDQWLHGQILVLQDILANPMDRKTIADAERNLRDAILQQGPLKRSLVDAKTTLKNLMTSFIDRLAEVTEQTGEYHAKIENYSQKIGSTDNIPELSELLNEIMRETRAIQVNAQHSHEEMISTRRQADQAQERSRQLEQELERVSEKMHEDQLTGALNRRGMDEALIREISRSDRQTTPLSLALLDIDNFKQLNDTLGHQVGDRSLVHLTNVIKQTLRPTDTVARYGGEEFIIILSETGLPEAVEGITRLQRELTKQLFMHNNVRRLITFSAGVALRGADETAVDLIGRADKAMYQAKKNGKNRVVAAD